MNEQVTPSLLTPDLSRQEPDTYKNLLVESLRRSTVYGEAAFNFVAATRGVSLERVALHPDKWGSAHHAYKGTIDLGTGRMTEEEKAFNFPFNTNRFTDEKVTTHIFTHEISHFLGEYIAEIYEGNDVPGVVLRYVDLMEEFVNNRKGSDNYGLSSHASSPRYIAKGFGIQALEDMTDLIAYYVTDPNYLKAYLHFLTNPDYGKQRHDYKLVTLTDEEAELVYSTVCSTIDFVLAQEVSTQ